MRSPGETIEVTTTFTGMQSAASASFDGAHFHVLERSTAAALGALMRKIARAGHVGRPWSCRTTEPPMSGIVPPARKRR